MAFATLVCGHCAQPFVKTGTPANIARAKFCSQTCVHASLRNRLPPMLESFRERLVERSAPQESGCILYTGQKGHHYGQLSYANRTYLAHRAAYMVHKGPIPAGLFVCHTCDIPLCINPDHLWLGTCSDNTRDMIQKGRSRFRFSGAESRLSDEQITAIRSRYDSGERQKDIAADLGVSQGYVSMICSGLRLKARNATS